MRGGGRALDYTKYTHFETEKKFKRLRGEISSNRWDFLFDIWDLKQPGRVCGRRREKTSEVWVENVVQSGKNKCLSKLPSRLVAEVGRLHWI